ncbi:MAG: serine hydrolase domain-containing protein [Emcibacteraceae bacterium]
MRFLSFVGLLFFCLVSVASAASIDEIVANFEKDFQEELKKNNVPGGAYAIIHNGEVIAMKGVGVRAKGGTAPVDENTVFRLASVSKTFAAGLTAELVAEDKFHWDDKIVDYVPEFRFKSSNYTNNLTVNHILSQSSSLVHNAYDNLVEANYPMSKIIAKFKDIDPSCKLGECYGYQNVLYSLIQPVIERATSSSYTDLMYSYIFDPLGMEHASLGYEAFLGNPNHAEPHVLTKRGWTKTKVTPSYYHLLPAAGVNASISDMAKWVMAQMGAFPQAYPQTVIDTVTTKHIRTLKEMRKRNWRSILKNAYYGYGWRIYDVGDTELIYHGGSVAGFRSEIAYSTEKNLALVMLLNAETRMGGDLNAKFWTEVFTPEPKITVAKVVKKPVPKRRVNIVTSIVPRDKPLAVPAL